MFFLCHSPVFMLLCCSVFWQGHLSFVVPFRNTCIKLLWSCDMFPWQKSSWASLLQPLYRSGVSTVSLPFYPFFFVLTKSKPAGCCVLAGHVLILGQGWPCVFILPDRMVLFFFLLNWSVSLIWELPQTPIFLHLPVNSSIGLECTLRRGHCLSRDIPSVSEGTAHSLMKEKNRKRHHH